VTDSNDSATPKPAVKTPRSALWVANIGGTFALLAGAAISFQGLTGLGGLVGVDHPWLLPIAIDVYAATTTIVALLLPASHHARKTAVWNARLGLSMSMAGNAAYRAMHLGSYTVSDGFLTFVGAWPSVIVERLLHLQGRLAVGDAPGVAAPPLPEVVDDNPAAVDDSAAPPVADNPGGNQNGNPATPPPVKAPVNRQKPPAKLGDNKSGNETTTERWVEVGMPVYVAVKAFVGRRPPEGAYADALATEVDRLIRAGELPEAYKNPSTSTAKRIRGEVEAKFPHLAPIRPAPEDAERAAS
jgi:hypothetical protein